MSFYKSTTHPSQIAVTYRSRHVALSADWNKPGDLISMWTAGHGYVVKKRMRVGTRPLDSGVSWLVHFLYDPQTDPHPISDCYKHVSGVLNRSITYVSYRKDDNRLCRSIRLRTDWQNICESIDYNHWLPVQYTLPDREPGDVFCAADWIKRAIDYRWGDLSGQVRSELFDDWRLTRHQCT